MERSGLAPVQGLETLLGSASSNSVLQAAVEEVTTDTIQVSSRNESGMKTMDRSFVLFFINVNAPRYI